MAIIPAVKNPVKSAIENKTYPQKKRTYLGMSGIGRKCAREQWYTWRWVKDRVIDARTNRIFKRGDLEEPRIVSDLEAVGIIFSDDQLEVTHITGHCLGHIDGIARNVPGAEKTDHLAEFKTMKNSKFNALNKKALLLGFEDALKELHSDYWCQVQAYMGYLGLTRCLYVITNKDTEERIYERITFYPQQFELIKERIMDILSHEQPPTRISEREDWYECKWCDFKEVCFGHEKPLTNCRTCRFANLMDKGIWLCGVNKYNKLSKEDQLKGCQLHSFLDGL